MTTPDLEGLAAQADGLVPSAAPGGDQAQAGDAGQLVAPTVSPNVGALCFLLAGMRELACMLLKVESPRRTLSDENVQRAADVLAPVADKYGLNLGTYLDGPEGPAVLVAGPILWGAWRALDAELAARRSAAKVEAKPASADDDAQA